MAIGIAFFLLGSLMGIIPELVRSKKGGVKQA
jgi:hypothetical protein